MTREKIDTLILQTAFLLEKQKELFDQAQENFNILLSFIDEKLKEIEKVESTQDFDDLKIIYGYVDKHKQRYDKQLQEDIDFLKEQLDVIEKIKIVEDDVKAKELLDMIIDKEEKLPEIDIFKERVCTDVESSKKELDAMLNDLKNALQEGSFHELKLLLEAIKDQEKEETEKECFPEVDLDGCSSCSECSQQPACNKDVMDDIQTFSDQMNENFKNEKNLDDNCDCVKDCDCKDIKTEK